MTVADPTRRPGRLATGAPERLDAFRGDRTYLGADHRRNERRTWIVTAICAATLVAQVAGGLVFLLFLDGNNLLFGLPYLVIGALLCYGAWRLQVGVKRKAAQAAQEDEAEAEPGP